MHLLAVTRKKFVFSWASTHFFYKNSFAVFFSPKSRFQIFASLSLFSYFKDLFFEYDSDQLNKTLLCVSFSSNKKKNYLLWRDHAFFLSSFLIFDANRDVKRYFFTLTLTITCLLNLGQRYFCFIGVLTV